jgi:hypothetical protein
MARRVSNHYSTRARPIEIADAPLRRIPSLDATLDYFPGNAQASKKDNDGDPILRSPIPGDMAFSDDSPTFAWFRAAQIIGLGTQLIGEDNPWEEESWADDANELLLPHVGNLETTINPALISETLSSLHESETYSAVDIDTRVSGKLWLEAATNSCGLAREAAASLLCVSLSSELEVVRVSAASELTWFNLQDKLSSDYLHDIKHTLEDGCRSKSPTIQKLAAHALDRIDHKNPALEELNGPDNQADDVGSGHTSIIVHGTWSRRNRWWTPDGDFFRYLKKEVAKDLYHREKYFRWEGRWKDDSRDGAAGDLADWTVGRGFPYYEIVFAHSHGANVALNAAILTRDPVLVKLLVLLHPAIVHRDDSEVDEILQHIGRIWVVRSRFDLVVLADRAFRLFPRLHERVRRFTIPRWLSHDVGIKSQIWQEYNMPNQVAFEKSMAERPFRDILERLGLI